MAWAQNHERALLADDVGLGKTVTTCAYLGWLAEVGVVATGRREDRALLVAPAALIPQWRGELRRLLPRLTVADSSERWMGRRPSQSQARAWLHAFPQGFPDLELVSYEHLRARLNDLTGRRLVVFDEQSEIKGQGREFEAARAVTDGAACTLGLTATPVELDVMETWRLLHVLRVPGLPLEAEWGERFVLWRDGYRRSHAQPAPRQPAGLRRNALPELRTHLRQWVLRRTGEDVGLTLPQVVQRQVWVPLTPPQEVAFRVASRLTDDLKRHQARERAAAHADGRSAKAEAALAWLLDRSDVRKAIVWAENLEHLDVMGGLLDNAGIAWVRVDGKVSAGDRARAVSRFRQDPSVRVLLGSTVLERGLNLQHCRVLLSLGSTFNPAREAQRVGRIRRIGSPHTTVESVTFLAETKQERRKATALSTRANDAALVLAG